MSAPTNPYGIGTVTKADDGQKWNVASATGDADAAPEGYGDYEEIGKKLGAGCCAAALVGLACGFLTSCMVWLVALNVHLVQHFMR